MIRCECFGVFRIELAVKTRASGQIFIYLATGGEFLPFPKGITEPLKFLTTASTYRGPWLTGVISS